jgi:hypothetical protein
MYTHVSKCKNDKIKGKRKKEKKKVNEALGLFLEPAQPARSSGLLLLSALPRAFQRTSVGSVFTRLGSVKGHSSREAFQDHPVLG